MIEIMMNGNLPFIKWLHNVGNQQNNTLIVQNLPIAAEYGHYNILEWAYQQKLFPTFTESPDLCFDEDQDEDYIKYCRDCDICSSAVTNGNLQTLKWLKFIGCPWNQKVYEEAIFNKHLHIFEWIIETGTIKLNFGDMIHKAIIKNRLDIFLFIKDKYQEKNEEEEKDFFTFLDSSVKSICKKNIYQFSLDNSSTEIFDWALAQNIQEYESCISSPYKMHFFVSYRTNNGHLDKLKLYVDKGYSFKNNYSDTYCSLAAESGHLDVLKFLKNNGAHWCHSTCEKAILGGHVETLKWAIENGCDMDETAVEIAASCGYLHILEYIRETKYAHYIENVDIYWKLWNKGKSINTINWAINNGIKFNKNEWEQFKFLFFEPKKAQRKKLSNFLFIAIDMIPEGNEEIVNLIKSEN